MSDSPRKCFIQSHSRDAKDSGARQTPPSQSHVATTGLSACPARPRPALDCPRPSAKRPTRAPFLNRRWKQIMRMQNSEEQRKRTGGQPESQSSTACLPACLGYRINVRQFLVTKAAWQPVSQMANVAARFPLQITTGRHSHSQLHSAFSMFQFPN